MKKGKSPVSIALFHNVLFTTGYSNTVMSISVHRSCNDQVLWQQSAWSPWIYHHGYIILLTYVGEVNVQVGKALFGQYKERNLLYSVFRMQQESI